MDIHALIASYGYLVVFLGAVFEGETILLIAGFASHEGLLSLPLILVVGFVGAVVGDTAWFLLGKYRSEAILTRFPSIAKVVARPVRFIHLKPKLLASTMRFMYGFRTVIPFSLGMSPLSVRSFILYNSIGALLWVVSVSILGYLFGDLAEEVIGNIKKYEFRAIILTALTVATTLGALRIIRFFFRKSTECILEK